jgi:hypothetical protein
MFFTIMFALEYVGASPLGGWLRTGDRIPVTAAGVVFVGELRPLQDRGGAQLVALNDPTVSSGKNGHCRIWLRGREVALYDCGSDNGTWTTRDGRIKRIGSWRTPDVLSEGAEISIGRCRFRLVAIPELG